MDLRRHVAGHVANLLVGLLGRPRLAEVDVVHVAAGAVGQQRDERRIEPVGVEQPLDFVAEHGEVVGGDRAAAGAADVVQAISGIERDRPAARLANREERDRRIGRPGRLDEVRAGAGIHLHLVDAAERVLGHRARLQIPAAIEEVLRGLGRAVADLRRPQVVHGPPHAVGDPLDDELLIVVEGVGVLEAVLPCTLAAECVCVAEISTCEGGMPASF